MTEIILGIITLASLALNAWSLFRYQEQEKRYIKAILSKDVIEFTESEIAEQPKPKEDKINTDEYTPTADLSDEQFDKMIKKEIKDGKK